MYSLQNTFYCIIRVWYGGSRALAFTCNTAHSHKQIETVCCQSGTKAIMCRILISYPFFFISEKHSDQRPVRYILV